MKDIFEKITQYHNNCVIEEHKKQEDKNNEIENLKKQILSKGDKIKHLIKLGAHCYINGLFKSDNNVCHYYLDSLTRKNGFFLTDSYYHRLGFCCNFTRLGIYGGGACDYNMSTDGDIIYVTGSDTLYVLKRFVNELEEFEHDLLNYIEEKIK